MLTAEPAAPFGRTLFSSLNGAQQRVLVALVELCPGAGEDIPGSRVAVAAGMTPGPVKLALGGLRRRRLVDHTDDAGDSWAPTFSGRVEVRAVQRT